MVGCCVLVVTTPDVVDGALVLLVVTIGVVNDGEPVVGGVPMLGLVEDILPTVFPVLGTAICFNGPEIIGLPTAVLVVDCCGTLAVTDGGVPLGALGGVPVVAVAGVPVVMDDGVPMRVDGGVPVGIFFGETMGVDGGVPVGVDGGVLVGVDGCVPVKVGGGVAVEVDGGVPVGMVGGVPVGVDGGVPVGVVIGVPVGIVGVPVEPVFVFFFEDGIEEIVPPNVLEPVLSIPALIGFLSS